MDNFWQLYGDFLPSPDECTSFLLAIEVGIFVANFEDPFATLSFNHGKFNQCVRFTELMPEARRTLEVAIKHVNFLPLVLGLSNTT